MLHIKNVSAAQLQIIYDVYMWRYEIQVRDVLSILITGETFVKPTSLWNQLRQAQEKQKKAIFVIMVSDRA